MKASRYFLALTICCLPAIDHHAAEAATIEWGTIVSLPSTNIPNNALQATGVGLRFGFHSDNAFPDGSGVIAQARSGASVTINPLSWLSSLSAEASQNATVAFMLVPGPGNHNAGQLARLSVVLDGMFVGAAGAGIAGITRPSTGSYSSEVTARVTSPFPEFDFSQDFNGHATFASGGETQPVHEQFSSTMFLNYNQPFLLTVALDTRATKDRVALATSNFSSGLAANVQLVPEPTSRFLLLTGLLALAIIRFVSLPVRNDSLRGHRRARADRVGQ